MGSGGDIHEPLTPTAAPASAGCPSGWLIAHEPLFSVCYPPDYQAEHLTVTAPSAQTFLAIRLTSGAPAAATPGSLTLRHVAGFTPVTSCAYEGEQVDPSAQTSIAPYRVDGLDGMACTAITAYATQFKGQLEGPGGAYAFHVDASGDEQLSLAKQILGTMRTVETGN